MISFAQARQLFIMLCVALLSMSLASSVAGQAKKPSTVSAGYLIIGTYMIHRDALEESNFNAAAATMVDTGQGMYYKSEFAGGVWFNLGQALNVEDILNPEQSTAVTTAEVEQLKFTVLIDHQGTIFPLQAPAAIRADITILREQQAELSEQSDQAHEEGETNHSIQLSMQVENLEAQIVFLQALLDGNQEQASQELKKINNQEALLVAMDAKGREEYVPPVEEVSEVEGVDNELEGVDEVEEIDDEGKLKQDEQDEQDDEKVVEPDVDPRQEELPQLTDPEQLLEQSRADVQALPVESLLTPVHQLKIDVPPILVQGRAFIPIRPISESFGALVVWNPEERSVTISKDKVELVCYVDSDIAYVNGEAFLLDVPPLIINNRTMVPLRFVVEGLGLQIEWLEQTQTILIN